MQEPFYIVRHVFEEKTVLTFLDDAYSLTNSHKTRDLYKQILRSFNGFCLVTYNKNMLELIQDIKDKPLEQILDVFLEYKRYMDSHPNRYGNTISNNTKRVRLSVLKNFFRYCGIKIHHEDIHEHVKIGRRMRVQKFALDQQTVSNIISKIDRFEFKALSVLLASTGMRVMEAITLQASDFDFSKYPASITIRAKETKTNESRVVYLTNECAGMFEQLIKNKPETRRFLFGRPSNPASIYGLYGYTIRRTLRKIGLYKVLDNGNNQITIHSFRSFFRTYAGHIISRDFAESFIGHRFYLSEYENMPEEEKKKLFLRLEPYITFSLVKLQTKLTNPDIISLQNQVEELQNKIKVLAGKFLIEERTTSYMTDDSAKISRDEPSIYTNTI